MSTSTIQDRSDETTAGLEAQIPKEAAQAFRDEQAAFRAGDRSGFPVAGDRLPDATLLDAHGAEVSLAGVVDGGPAVLVFYRGGWCPYCSVTLRAYQSELLPELDAFGARLVAISPQTPDASLSTREKEELEFDVLSDAHAGLAHRLGIAFTASDAALEAQRSIGLDIRPSNVQDSVDLPMPTVLVVDVGGTIRFADVQPDYTARTEVSAILDALRAL